jgi:hypothetical protein
MAGKAVAIAASIAGALALGVGGYFANEWRICSGLEADAIYSAHNIRNSTRLRYYGGELGLDLPFDDLESAGRKDESLMVKRLTMVYDRCGYRAGQAASQKVQDVLALGL